MTPDFDHLVGRDVEPEERARLLQAHELLIAAGPPPELPPSLAHPRSPEGEVVPFFNRRRHAAAAVLAATLAAALFGIGFLVGNSDDGEGFAARTTILMRATPAAPAGAVASIALGHRDAAGNWPMLVRASNLKELPEGGYYALWLTRDGRAVAPCGSFVVRDAATTQVRFSVYYQPKRFDGWVLTYQPRGHHTPGRVLLQSV
jgi:hypothetical protein